MEHTIHEEVKAYYGQQLKSNKDLKTNACCTTEAPPQHIQAAMQKIADEVHATYYGCGLTIPAVVEGLTILDLGSGSGRDCFIASDLVGATGNVIGVDMTAEQLAIANKYIPYHTEKFGYAKPNVQFLQGNIERLDELNLQEASIDLIISNCVINLAGNKQKVLHDAYQLLKPGGEMYFSDVYSDRRIPQALQKNSVLWGECLSGALYWNDFLQVAKKAGFVGPRSVENHRITIQNQEVSDLVGDIQFYSVTYRLMKIEGLESDCEDYGQAVAYKGGVVGEENGFSLDDHHYFPTGKIMPVCGNTFRMLHNTRFHVYFDFFGSWDKHYGIFEGCGGAMPFSQSSEVSDAVGGSCC